MWSIAGFAHKVHAKASQKMELKLSDSSRASTTDFVISRLGKMRALRAFVERRLALGKCGRVPIADCGASGLNADRVCASLHGDACPRSSEVLSKACRSVVFSSSQAESRALTLSKRIAAECFAQILEWPLPKWSSRWQLGQRAFAFSTVSSPPRASQTMW